MVQGPSKFFIYAMLVVAIITVILFFLIFNGYTVYDYMKDQPNSGYYDKKPDKTSEIKEFLEKDKNEREVWEKQNPDLVQKLREKEKEYVSRPSIGMTLSQVQSICGSPDHSSYMTTKDGTINAITYRNGKCEGVLGFNTEYVLVVISSY